MIHNTCALCMIVKNTQHSIDFIISPMTVGLKVSMYYDWALAEDVSCPAVPGAAGQLRSPLAEVLDRWDWRLGLAMLLILLYIPSYFATKLWNESQNPVYTLESRAYWKYIGYFTPFFLAFNYLLILNFLSGNVKNQSRLEEAGTDYVDDSHQGQ